MSIYQYHSQNRLKGAVSLVLIVTLMSLSVPQPVAAAVLQSSEQTVLNWQQRLAGYLDWGSALKTEPQRVRRRGVEPRTPESKEEKQLRVASVIVSPRAEVTMMSRESKIFTGIPVDSQGNTVQGLTCEWRSTDNRIIFIRKNGMAVAGNPGTAELVAQAGNRSGRVRVTVVSNPSQDEFPQKKSRRTALELKAAQSVGTLKSEAFLTLQASRSAHTRAAHTIRLHRCRYVMEMTIRCLTTSRFHCMTRLISWDARLEK